MVRQPSKKARKEAARALIDSIPLYAPWPDAAIRALEDLCGQPTGTLARVTRRENEDFPGDRRHLWVTQAAAPDAWASWSWVKRIDEPSEHTVLSKAARNGVLSTVRDVTLADACARCGGREYLQVDHHGTAFDDLLRGFIALEGMPEYDDFGTGGGRVFAQPWLAKWRAYHDERAHYQTLCRSCNASKGKK